MSYMMDFFAGIESKVLAAIETSKVQYPAYVFVRDEEASETGRLAFVDQNNVLKYIRGENKQQILHVTTLPEETAADPEVLYICNGIVYIYTDEGFAPMYRDYSTEVGNLSARVSTLEEKMEALETFNTELTEKITVLEEEDISLSSQITVLERTIKELEENQGGEFIELE